MLSLNNLTSTNAKKKKRVGRGFGSGKGGHTSGRGQKGQKTRGKIPLWFEGGQLPLIRRTPFLKGKSRFDPTTIKPKTVSLDQLEKNFKIGDVVDADAVVKVLKYDADDVARQKVKVLGNGKLTKSLTVKLLASAGAKKAIEAAGGSVE